MQWQPIETAPREQEIFIGAFIDGVFKFGRSAKCFDHGNPFEGEYWSGWYWSIDDCSDSVAEAPTHWMPLPSPPEKLCGTSEPDPKNCTAVVFCDGGRITTQSCTTKRPLIDDGESSDGERDYYICPDCRKNITIDYREN